MIAGTERKGRALLGCLLLGVVLSFCAEAKADDEAAARAQTLFVSGRAAAKQGDDALACADFAASLELYRTAGTLLNLALCEENLGRFTRSLAHFSEFLSTAAPADDRREVAASHLAKLEPRLARLVLRLAPTYRSVPIAVDDDVLNVDAMSGPMLLDPGVHRIVVSPQNQPPQSAALHLAEGLETTVDVPWATPAATCPLPALAARPVARPEAPVAPPAAPASTGAKTAGWILGGVGLTALAVSASTGVVILQKKHVVEEHCRSGQCDAEGWAAAETGRTLIPFGTVSLVVGALALGSASYLLFMPVVAPSGARAAVVNYGGAF